MVVTAAFVFVCLFFQPSTSNLFFQFLNILGQKALADAGIPYSAVEQACVGYVYGKYCHLIGV